MGNHKQKMLLAALSQCVADRDKAAADISFLLESGVYTDELKNKFEALAKCELTMDAIQVCYAKHFTSKIEEGKNNDNNGNNS